MVSFYFSLYNVQYLLHNDTLKQKLIYIAFLVNGTRVDGRKTISLLHTESLKINILISVTVLAGSTLSLFHFHHQLSLFPLCVILSFLFCLFFFKQCRFFFFLKQTSILGSESPEQSACGLHPPTVPVLNKVVQSAAKPLG